jgi:hypothetical protein
MDATGESTLMEICLRILPLEATFTLPSVVQPAALLPHRQVTSHTRLTTKSIALTDLYKDQPFERSSCLPESSEDMITSVGI